MSCWLKYIKRKIRIIVNQHFHVSNIIIKIERVYANVNVVIHVRVEDFEYIISAVHSA